MKCRKGDWVVFYHDWVEVINEDGDILGSFIARRSMCKAELDRYVRINLDVSEEYRIKRRST